MKCLHFIFANHIILLKFSACFPLVTHHFSYGSEFCFLLILIHFLLIFLLSSLDFLSFSSSFLFILFKFFSFYPVSFPFYSFFLIILLPRLPHLVANETEIFTKFKHVMWASTVRNWKLAMKTARAVKHWNSLKMQQYLNEVFYARTKIMISRYSKCSIPFQTESIHTETKTTTYQIPFSM